nr:cytochrome c biogenesis protein CcdA [Nocardiopsis gilva]
MATTAAMTGGFVAVFAAFGLAVMPLALSVERYLPWATVVIGVVLVGLGAWLLSGREVKVLLPTPTPGRPTRSLRWAATYGVAYAVASLSCTIGPFLAVTASALRSSTPVGAVGVFVAYAEGMGLVIGVLTVAVALAREGLAARLRRALPHLARGGGALLVLAGAYVAYYGVSELRVLSGASAADPVVGTATAIQSTLARLLDSIGPGWFALALLGLVGLGAARALRRSRRGRASSASSPDTDPAESSTQE